jgi:hypothetical protein
MLTSYKISPRDGEKLKEKTLTVYQKQDILL